MERAKSREEQYREALEVDDDDILGIVIAATHAMFEDLD